jgi:hypothetical protein
VASFEMTDEADFSIGFPAGSIVNPIVDLTVSFVRGRMDLEVEAVNPLDGTPVQTAKGKADLTKFSADVKVNLPSLNIDPGYVFHTPLADVTTGALTDGLTSLAGQTDTLEWSTDVRGTSEDQVVINAGDIAGVEVGDRFAIYNRTFYWSGAPCQSQYFGSIRAQDPAAVVEIDGVPSQAGTSFGRVVSGSLSAISSGAEALVSALKPGPNGQARTLKKGVKIGTIGTESVPLPDGSTFSLQAAIPVLLRDVIAHSNYWLKE